ncbi:hypothetical protein A7M79_00685 [Acinetobacter baumannii]|nr:hypothetical protein A7M79_00685 [Acinetobacter baumannii]
MSEANKTLVSNMSEYNKCLVSNVLESNQNLVAKVDGLTRLEEWLKTDNPYVVYNKEEKSVLKSLMLEKYVDKDHFQEMMAWWVIGSILWFFGSLLYFLFIKFTWFSFAVLFGYYFIIFLLKPLFVIKSRRAINKDLNSTYTVDQMISMKSNEGLKLRSTYEHLFNIYNQNKALTVLDVLLAREEVIKKMKSLKERYAETASVDEEVVKKIGYYKDEAYQLLKLAKLNRNGMDYTSY